MVKVIFMVKYGIIFFIVGFEEMNKCIEGKEKMCVIGDKLMVWFENEFRRVLVINFGMCFFLFLLFVGRGNNVLIDLRVWW